MWSRAVEHHRGGLGSRGARPQGGRLRTGVRCSCCTYLTDSHPGGGAPPESSAAPRRGVPCVRQRRAPKARSSSDRGPGASLCSALVELALPGDSPSAPARRDRRRAPSSVHRTAGRAEGPAAPRRRRAILPGADCAAARRSSGDVPRHPPTRATRRMDQNALKAPTFAAVVAKPLTEQLPLPPAPGLALAPGKPAPERAASRRPPQSKRRRAGKLSGSKKGTPSASDAVPSPHAQAQLKAAASLFMKIGNPQLQLPRGYTGIVGGAPAAPSQSAAIAAAIAARRQQFGAAANVPQLRMNSSDPSGKSEDERSAAGAAGKRLRQGEPLGGAGAARLAADAALDMDDSDRNSNGKRRNRGSYKCSRCGEPKKGHVCPFKVKFQRRSNEPPPATMDAACQAELDEDMTIRHMKANPQS